VERRRNDFHRKLDDPWTPHSARIQYDPISQRLLWSNENTASELLPWSLGNAISHRMYGVTTTVVRVTRKVWWNVTTCLYTSVYTPQRRRLQRERERERETDKVAVNRQCPPRFREEKKSHGRTDIFSSKIECAPETITTSARGTANSS